MNPLHRLLTILFVLRAVNLPAGIVDVKFEHLSIEHGLSQSNLTSMIQDQAGFMWFGTLDGLNKYDGYEFTIYKHSADDTSSLSSSSIWSLYEDRDGDIWISTIASGLNRFDPRTGRFTRFRHDPRDPRSLSDDRVRAIAEDASGHLWIGTRDSGLNRFDRKSGQFVHLRHNPDDPTSLGDNHVRAMLLDRDGSLWVGTVAGGLNRMVVDSSGAIEFIRYIHDPDDNRSLSHNHVESLCQDRHGTIWIGTYGGGLNKLVRDTNNGEIACVHYRADGKPGSLSHDVVEAIVEDHVGTLWIGTNAGGLNRFDHEMQRFIQYKNEPTDPSSLSHNNIEALFEDRTGNLWIGTWGGGINKLDRKPRKFLHYRHKPGDENSLCHRDVRAISEGPNGALWVGTAGGGLDCIDGRTGTITHYRHDETDPASLSNNNVRALCFDRTGALWVGTYGGGLNKMTSLSRNKPAKFIHYDEDIGLNRHVWALYEDSQGQIWIGTNAGLSCLDPKTNNFTHFRHDPDDETSLSHSIVRTIYEDLAGRVWIGTYGGLNLLDQERGTFTRYTHERGNPNSLSHNGVMAIYQDQPDVLWLGTLGGGLNRFDLKTREFRHYLERDGLPNDFVHAIMSDSVGNLWMSTNRGLAHFDTAKQRFRNYDVTDGLQSNEFNVGAAYESVSGELFFGGVNGLTAFHPDRIQDNPHIPEIVITGFKVFNRPVEFEQSLVSLDKIDLTYRERFFSFEFAALDYTNPSKNRYAYKMEGFDSEWIDCGERRFASYTNLDPGSYIFRVKGSNNDGIWNEKGTPIAITIEPPFWQTWWFRILVFIGIAGVLAGFYHYRMSNLKKEKMAQEAFSRQLIEIQEKERKRIASELHDSLGQDLLVINNGLKQVVGETSEKKLAQELNQLSEVTLQSINEVREISSNLHPHQVERLGLKKAIESMTARLSQSSKLRFNLNLQDIQNGLTKDDEVSIYRIIQEATNNIIKHSGAHEAHITLTQNDNFLHLLIQDNGAGFNVNSTLREGKGKKGFGLTNISERVKILNGQIRIESTPNKGTTLDIKLPLRRNHSV